MWQFLSTHPSETYKTSHINWKQFSKKVESIKKSDTENFSIDELLPRFSRKQKDVNEKNFVLMMWTHKHTHNGWWKFYSLYAFSVLLSFFALIEIFQRETLWMICRGFSCCFFVLSEPWKFRRAGNESEKRSALVVVSCFEQFSSLFTGKLFNSFLSNGKVFFMKNSKQFQWRSIISM